MPRPIALSSPWKDLAEKLGGVGELARSLGGVDPDGPTQLSFLC